MCGINMDNISNKNILVTGGTGSFGKAFITKVLKEYNPTKIVVFSRDEDKQHTMRLQFNDARLSFEIGDVRDEHRVFEVIRDNKIQVIFHASALKQVPAGEFFPLEVVKTNILGAEHVVNAAIRFNVEKIVGLSTDKAAYPINAMGMSKALMEKIFLAAARKSTFTKVCLTRYGNVMCSRGSVIPLWIKNAKKDEPILVTNPDMTRFLMSLNDAIDLVIYAVNEGENGQTLIKKAPACTMLDLAREVRDLFNPEAGIVISGIRHSEKMHETLITTEEFIRAEDKGDYYAINQDDRGLNYNLYFSEGKHKVPVTAYTSENTYRLNIDEIQKLLLSLKEVQDEIKST